MIQNNIDFIYDNTTKSYAKNVKPDIKDKITVELGDSKDSSKFYPQAKIQRFDNEVNFSYRLKEAEKGTESITTKDNQVIWEKGNISAKMYELPIDETNPEGGFEFEVVLKERPKTNVVEFTLRTKGLEFFYQPELTQEEIKEGSIRPENVVGSYAVYYKDCPANYVGGKEYKTGKVGHIFRPKIIDSVGTEVWGELNIDIESGILSVVIPQDFLDKAVYPVRHAAGLTFGYSGTPATKVFSGYSGSTLKNCDVYAGAAGTVSSMSLYCAASSGTENIQLGLYTDSNNSKVATTASIGIDTNAGWKSGNLTGTTTAVNYKLWWQNDTGNIDVYGDSSGGSRYWRTGETFGTWNATLTPSNGPTGTRTGIYATYTAGASTTPQTITGESRIQEVVNKTIPGLSRITETVLQTISGKARITTTTTKTILGKGSIQKTASQTILGKANISVTTYDYSKGGAASLPTDTTDLAPLTTTEVTNISTDDGNYAVNTTSSPNFSIFQLKNKNSNNTDQISVSWKGKTDRLPSTSTVYLQIYNYNSSAWETLSSNNSASINTDFTLTGIKTTNLSNYYGTGNWISCRIYQEVK